MKRRGPFRKRMVSDVPFMGRVEANRWWKAREKPKRGRWKRAATVTFKCLAMGRRERAEEFLSAWPRG